jgi:molybdopterin synthase catalytic subunit
MFVEGAITIEHLAKLSDKLHQSSCGAHAHFMGQIRSDSIDGKQVSGIDYSCYQPMGEQLFAQFIAEAVAQFSIENAYILHSKGLVKIGEYSVLVYVTAAHRKNVFRALEWLVEKLKYDVPIWKKEIFSDGSYRWKEDKRGLS